MPNPTVDKLVQTDGVAGQRMVIAHYKYPGEEPKQAVFVGTTYGEPGPVVMKVGGMEVFVREPDRFGQAFNKDWVIAFYTSDPSMVELAPELRGGNPVGRGKVRDPLGDLADREADRIDNLRYNRDGL